MDIFEYIDRVKANFDKQPEPRYNTKKYFMGGSVTTPKRGLVDEPGSYAGNPYANSPKFKKFLKEYGDYYKIGDVVRAYERKLATEGKTVGIKKLYEALGPDNPYTYDVFNNIFSRADKKITKNMSNKEKNNIKAGQRLKKIIIDNVGEPELLGDIQKKFKNINVRTKGTTGNRVFTLNKTKIKNLNKALNKNYNSMGLRENTIDNVFELIDNKDFMNSLKAYKGGKIDETSPLFKTLFRQGSADMPYAYMTLGRALRGEIAMEGIKKDKALGNKIIKSISGDFEGPLGTAAKRWAKFQMAKHFDDPNASYSSITQTIKNAFKDVGVKNLDIDEIFPTRTGQITIGKGSGAYNQIVQFIDAGINQGAKRAFDGRSSKRYRLIIDAYKNKNFDKVKQLVDAHQTDTNNFYKKNPEAKGKVKLTQLNYNPKTKKFASPTEIYGKDVFPSKIQKDMDRFYRKTGLSLDVGSTMTLEKAAAEIKKDPIKLLKKMGYRCPKNTGGSEDLQCYLNDVKKTREDIRSSNPEIRSKAIVKQRNALKQAQKIPEIMKSFRRGAQTTLGYVGGFPGLVLEGLIELGTYDYYRNKGYSDKQAAAETFFAKKLGTGDFKPGEEGSGFFDGSEKLLQEELVGNDPAKQKYFDIKDAMDQKASEFETINKELQTLRTGKRGYGIGTKEEILTKEKELEQAVQDYSNLENQIKPGTSLYQSYQTGLEKQQSTQAGRREELRKSSNLTGLPETQMTKDNRARDAGYRRKKEMEEYRGNRDSIMDLKGKSVDDFYKEFGMDPKNKFQDIYGVGGYDLLDKIGIAGGVSKLASGGLARASFGIGGFTKAQFIIQRMKNSLKQALGKTDADSKYVKETFPNMIKELEAKPELANNENVFKAFSEDLPKDQRVVVHSDDSIDFFQQSKFGPHNIKPTIKFAEDNNISIAEAKKILKMEPEDQVLEKTRLQVLKDKGRTRQASGGLTSLTRTIPPQRGPHSQGLASFMKNGKR